MATRKVAVTLQEETLIALDRLVQGRQFPSRSKAMQKAVEAFLLSKTKRRLAEECAKLDPAEEVALAEEGMAEEAAKWPEY